MERLDEAKVPNPHQSELANYIAAFEWLLWDRGCSIQGDRKSDTSTPEEPKLPGQMEAAPDSVSRHSINIVRTE